MKTFNINNHLWWINLTVGMFFFGQCWAQLTTTSVHDPVVIKEVETFYLFSTGRGITLQKSTDLKHWEKCSPVFDQKPSWSDSVVPGFKNHIWAPDISYYNGVYYLYYAISAFGKNTSAIGVATNTTLDENAENYQWVDHGIVIESAPERDNWNAIDPNLIIDEQGSPWLSFGSFWGGLQLVELDASLLKPVQPIKLISIARRNPSKNERAIEAPFVYKRGGYFYLFASWDYCCKGENSTYKVVVGRSKKVSGPYLDQEGKSMYEGGGTLFIEGDENWYGIGHNSIYDFDSATYFFAHGYDAHDQGKPKFIVKQVSWDENNWPTIKTD